MTKNTRASIDDVGPLIAWLAEQAIQAADADQPKDAGMLTWAAQVIGECMDEDDPDPPAEGEVGELVHELRSLAGALLGLHLPTVAATATRAAELLQQRHPEPVPVSERLPGPEDCDGDGRCWLIGPRFPTWDLSYPPKTTSSTMWTHWLTATALPLP
jgi:hypothetical protein